MIKYLSLPATVLAMGIGSASAEPFTFIALGDAPYGKPEDVYAPFEMLIGEINNRTPALVLHVGDTKSGSTECSDKMLDDQRQYLNSFSAPTLYAPGDNEWTDCHRSKAGGYDPLERLAYIRDTYYADADKSFGQDPADVEHQGKAGYPENTRMLLNNVMFMTAHVVGSNNNFEIRDIEAVKEFFDRDAANLEWLENSFAAAIAADAKALVLGIHADMFEFDFGPSWSRETWLRHSGFNNFGPALKNHAAAFGKPVLLVYGDSHIFRQTRPFPSDAPNILALEVPGSKNMDAVEVTVDTETSGVFSVDLIQNPDENW